MVVSCVMKSMIIYHFSLIHCKSNAVRIAHLRFLCKTQMKFALDSLQKILFSVNYQDLEV